MPFTLAHPAAILPFRRFATRSTSLCALVIGSMSPDFVYFFSLGVNGAFSHSLMGIFLFCVPASLAVYIAFYLFLRQPLIALMPCAVAARLTPHPEWIPKSIFSILCISGSFAIGAGTHIAWDAFTHGNTLVVRNFEVFRTPVASIGGLKIPLYKVLQHLSSVLGLMLLAICTLRWMRQAPPTFVWRYHLTRIKRMLVSIGILIAGVGGGIVGSMTRPARTFEHLFFNGVVSGMASMAFVILIFCACWRIRTLQEDSNV